MCVTPKVLVVYVYIYIFLKYKLLITVFFLLWQHCGCSDALACVTSNPKPFGLDCQSSPALPQARTATLTLMGVRSKGSNVSPLPLTVLTFSVELGEEIHALLPGPWSAKIDKQHLLQLYNVPAEIFWSVTCRCCRFNLAENTFHLEADQYYRLMYK